MKTTNLLRSAAVLTFLSFIVMSCSKDAAFTELQKGSSETISQKSATSSEDFGDMISTQLDPCLTMYVLPQEAEASVTVYNGSFTSEEVFPDEKNFVSFGKIPAGTYNVRIHPYNPLFSEFIIEDVIIVAKETTDLGDVIVE